MRRVTLTALAIRLMGVVALSQLRLAVLTDTRALSIVGGVVAVVAGLLDFRRRMR